MRIVNIAALLAALLLGAGTAPAATSLTNGEIVYDLNGNKGKFKVGEGVMPVHGAQLVYVELDATQAKAMGKLEGTLLFFDKTGACTAELPGDKNDNSSTVFASLKGDILAVDAGTWVVRDWIFFAYPTMKSLERNVSYLSNDKGDLTWVGDDAIVITTIKTDSPRQCGYDPCGPRSVDLYSIRDDKSTPLFAGTDLCDYAFDSFDGKTVRALKSCVKQVGDWNAASVDELEKRTTKHMVTRALP